MKGIIFSDLDGTLVHYEQQDMSFVDDAGADEFLLLPSSSGRQGVISRTSLHKLAALREAGLKLVLVSGARSQTLLMRLPFLPAADAYVAENGGCIFLPAPGLPTACPLREDMAWVLSHSAATGPISARLLAPQQRQGLLWEWYRQLSSAGWRCDASGYSACFRLQQSPGKDAADLAVVCAATPAGLAHSVNLGTTDFYPASSGKCAAGRYLMKLLGGSASQSVLLCDDDNDLELGRLVSKAFVTGATSPSMAAAVAAQPQQFVMASSPPGHAATLEMLDAVAAHFGVVI